MAVASVFEERLSLQSGETLTFSKDLCTTPFTVYAGDAFEVGEQHQSFQDFLVERQAWLAVATCLDRDGDGYVLHWSPARECIVAEWIGDDCGFCWDVARSVDEVKERWAAYRSAPHRTANFFDWLQEGVEGVLYCDLICSREEDPFAGAPPLVAAQDGPVAPKRLRNFCQKGSSLSPFELSHGVAFY